MKRSIMTRALLWGVALPIFVPSANARILTYDFTAKVTTNTVGSSYRVGDIVTGSFSYKADVLQNSSWSPQVYGGASLTFLSFTTSLGATTIAAPMRKAMDPSDFWSQNWIIGYGPNTGSGWGGTASTLVFRNTDDSGDFAWVNLELTTSDKDLFSGSRGATSSIVDGPLPALSYFDVRPLIHWGWGTTPSVGYDALISSLTLVSDTGAAVPEPGAWAMLLSGAAIAGGALRRRRLAPQARA